jgi:nitrate/nitrite transporter NarK
MTFTDNPKDHPRITAEELAELPEPKKINAQISLWPLFKRMWPVTLTYFCYGWTLWLFLSWVPQYFLHSHGLDLKQSAWFASSIFLSGVIGDTLGGTISDKLYARTGNLRLARCQMVSICMVLAAISLIPLMLVHDLTVSTICLALGFFFAEMCIGPMWAVPMDIAPSNSGAASGMMNTGSAFAAIVCPVLSGFVIDQTGNWEIPFIGSIVLMLLGALMASRMHPQKKFHADKLEAQPAI